jgi:transposase
MVSKEVFMEMIALRHQGYSIRKIAETLGIHRNTVKRHLENAEFPQYHKSRHRESILAPYLQTIRDFLEEDDYQATWIFNRIKMMDYAGGYDTVKRYVQIMKEQKTRLAYTRFETEPGRQAQFDWGDFQINEPGGTVTTVYASILVLGYSRGMYAEYTGVCTLEAFMDSHIRAFRYFGGVPREILYDNMKHVVTGKDEQGRPVFNNEFLHFAHHYGFQPKAAPPYSPWVKGKVERPIDYLRQRFWRGYAFDSTEKANRDLLPWLDQTGNRRIHGTHHRPVYERWQEELPHLLPLPVSEYDTSVKVFRKVYRDCQISYNGNRYVAPHRAVGKRVMLKIKHGTIRIFHDQDLLATYQEPQGKNNLVSNPRFYEDLRHDKEQLRRKYGKSKGRATRGLVNGSLWVNVAARPLAEYDKYARGGVSWNS